MSKPNKNGVWVVPPAQVKEFMSGPIDYDKLIRACIESPRQKLKAKRKTVKVEPVEFEIEIDTNDPEYIEQESKKSIWSRDLRTVFKK